MSADPQMIFQSSEALQAELDDLRHSLLPAFLGLAAGITWAWFGWAILSGDPPGWAEAAIALAALVAYAVLRWRGRRHTLACWTLIASLIVTESLLVSAHPATLSPALGVLTVITANALLGPYAALLALGASWLGGLGTRYLAAGRWELGLSSLGVLGLYALTLLASWLAARPVGTVVHWALSGWGYANKALIEARERRGELHRVVRALEEATYRIERMNNELIVARREAEEARALKARLAATVSHELRGPLNLILGFSKLMALSPENYPEPLPPAYRADVHTIHRNCQHLVSLVDDILDLSQIEAQRLPLVKDRVDLEEDVLKKVVDIVQPLATRKGLALRQELHGALPWVLADPVRLRQALLNLLTNAVRFTERGSVTVRARRDGERLVASVQDTGSGIGPEELPRLFKEFSQVQPGESRPGGGSGLGLSISKHLIELHGGEIWVESARGVGTTFHFSVPLPGTEALAATVKTEEKQPETPVHEDVLVIHDDPGMVRLLARYIERYHIVGVPEEGQVAALTDALHPRAIVAPPESAGRVSQTLASAGFDVPVVACALPHTRERDRDRGILSYLIKPIAPDMLTAAMHGVARNGQTTILLVDDDPDVVRLLERMLTALPHPYRILKAYDGRQALQIMEEVVPDVVFMDLVMPELDGEQTIAEMRRDARLRAVPVVVISARDRFEGRATLGTSLSVHCQTAIPIARGAHCLQALLDALAPDYLAATPQTAP